MRKTLFKYIKFLISMVLILGLVAPSYASLSASDGSAFVTKAEFDSALADFNSRLTTFEAGINSKIDSQVTSYLDRNGIWSGKVQDDLLKKYVELNSYKNVIQSATAASSNKKDLWTFESTLSKTGLLYLVISEELICNNRKNNWRNYIRAEGTNVGNDTNMTIQFEIAQNGESLFNNILFSSVPAGGSAIIISFPDKAFFPILCFIEKESCVFTMREYWINTRPDTTYDLNLTYGFWLESGRIRFSANDAKIF